MSGSSIGTVVGTIVGFFLPGGPSVWGTIGGIVGGAIDPDQIQGPRLTDAQTQLSIEGVPRTIVYGTCAVAGNIIQVGPLVEHKRTEKASKGGPEQTTYTYTRTVAIRICEAAPNGGAMKLRRVWKDDKLVYDASSGSTITADSQAFASILTFYDGSEDQLPDPSLEALPEENGGGVGNVPAYRGSCYAVLTDLDCTDRQGAVSQFRWEVSSAGTEEPVETGGIEAGELGGFTNAHRPLADTESAYSYTGQWINGHGAGVASATFDSIDEVLDYFATQSGALGRPEHYIGYIGSSAAPSVVAGSQNSSAVQFDEIAAQPDVTDLQSLALLYQWVEPVEWHDVVPNDASFCIYTLGEWHGSSNGTVMRRVSAHSSGVEYKFLRGCGSSDIDGIYPLVIEVKRKRVAPASVPDGAISIPDKTGWYLDVSGNLIEAKEYAPVSGTFKALSIGSGVSGSDPTQTIKAYPQGPVLASTDPNYTSQAYWDAAYAAAVAAGAMPAGMTYSAAGTGSVNTTYPILTTSVFAQEPSQATVVTPGYVALADIITDLMGRAGIDTDQVDVSALAGITVRGFPVARQTSAAEAVRALQQVFLFDLPEWGDSGEIHTKLRAVLRGGPSLLTLTDDDLVETDDDEETRGQQVEFPRKLSLTAADPEANYEPVTEAAERESENVKAVGEQQVSTAVVLTREEIAQLADKLLKLAWEQAAGRLTREVPEEFSAYTPSDPITYGGRRYRIETVELRDGSSRWELVRDRAKAYESSAAGGTPLTPTPPVSGIKGPTMFAALNLPRLHSQDTTPGMYVAVAGLLPGWAGCDLYLSTDDGVTEQLVATILDASTMGTLSADLADDGATLSVNLYDGELDSATVDQLLARQNAAAVTTDGVSEILQFQTATETAEDAYDLTDLSRGVLGTAADDHVAGDSFVALDAVTFLPLDIALAGKTLIFRPVSRGTVPANNATYSVVFKPQFVGPQVVEAYTDDAGNVYTDDAGNTYYYEVPST